ATSSTPYPARAASSASARPIPELAPVTIIARASGILVTIPFVASLDAFRQRSVVGRFGDDGRLRLDDVALLRGKPCERLRYGLVRAVGSHDPEGQFVR